MTRYESRVLSILVEPVLENVFEFTLMKNVSPDCPSQSSCDQAWYSLRRTLPPWSFEANLEELKTALPRYRVDELVVKVDTEEFSHGQPPLDWVRAYQEKLFRVKAVLDELGVVYSINPWITVGHIDRGRDARNQLPGLQTFVGHDGTVSKACASPLCPVWRDHIAKVWRHYAETLPDAIWFEDDIRLFNHLPVKHGCFCPLHLKRFSELIGQPVTREALVAALLQPGAPHPWRKRFLEMQAEVIRETIGFITETVRQVSPQTRFGLMSSGPRRHCSEGRRWSELAEAFGGDQPLISRPPLGNYDEASLRGLYYSKDSILLTRHCLPENTDEQTEVENVPFSRYSKSVRFTFLQMALSFACGARGTTLNLFDHCGTPMEAEPHYGRVLGERKAFFNALCERSLSPGRYRGIQLLFNETSGERKHLKTDADMPDLEDGGEAMMELLESHGFATTYEREAVVASCGEQLRAYSDAELDSFLSGALFLDGAAAKVLVERGFGEWIGLHDLADARLVDVFGVYAAEEFYATDFGGAPGTYLTLTVPDLTGRPSYFKPELAKGVEVLSELVDVDAVRCQPALYVYENAAGGRIAVHLLELESAYGVAFRHTFRRAQLNGVLHWLGRGSPPVQAVGGVYPLVLRKDGAHRSFLALFNLSLDPWPEPAFRIRGNRRIESVEMLAADGTWKTADDVTIDQREDSIKLALADELPPARTVFLTVVWALS